MTVRKLMFYQELSQEERPELYHENDMFFVYKGKTYNTSCSKIATCADYDGMFDVEDSGKYIAIKYLDNDTVIIGECR